MGRRSTIWKRKGRGFWTTLHGKQRYLSHDRKEAQRRLNALLASSQPIIPGQFSVAQLVELFLADCQKRVKAGDLSTETMKTHKSYLDRWAESCRRLKPEHLRAYHVQQWIDSTTWNSTTKATAVSRVKLWSRWCEASGYIDADRLRSARGPQRLTRRAASPDDLDRLERSIGDPSFRDYYHLLYDTGCRPGELEGLRAVDVDFSQAFAAVSGKSGRRIIGLTSRAVSILRKCALTRPEGPLLRTLNGAAWSQSNVKFHWRKWLKVAHTSTHIVPYHCRHDLYRRWHAAGISDIVISKQMGHSLRGQPHLGVLNAVYAHVDAEPLAQAAQAAEQARLPTRPKRRQGRI